MFQNITIKDLPLIALGATALGSGGGGDPAPEVLLTQYFFEQFGAPQLISVSQVAEDRLIVPIGFMGSPQVAIEMCANGEEFDHIFDKIETHFQKKIGALIAAEIGGGNCFTPLIIASKKQLPVIDGDTLGRAFPELHMSSCALFNIPASPLFIADNIGNIEVVHTNSPQETERKGREICMKMGSNAACSVYIMTKQQAQKACLPNTLTLAKHLGHHIQNKDIEILQKNYGLEIVTKGVVVDIISENTQGFSEGKIVIQTQDGYVDIYVQNEYLLAQCEKKTLIATPDIICLFEEEYFTPLAVERVQYGMHVLIASLPAPKIWKTEPGLAIVGPQAFGFSI